MDTITEVEQNSVRSVIDGFRENPPSRQTTRAFLFKQAQAFIKTTPDAHLSRRDRRIVARELAGRMKSKLALEQKAAL